MAYGYVTLWVLIKGKDVKKSMKKGKHKTVEYGRYGYLFIAPFFLAYLIFSAWPLLYTVILSFKNEYYSTTTFQTISEWNGIENYIFCLVDSSKGLFQTRTIMALGNTIFMWIFNFVPQIALSLLLAAWFTDSKIKLRGQGAYKVIVYMPNIITASTISVLFYSMFNYPSGPVNLVMTGLGIWDEPFQFFQNALATRLIVAFIQFWMWYGNTMVVLIAGILGIDPALFEAANVDGANSTQIFWHITVPLLRPILLYTLVTSAIGGLQMFDIPKLLTTSGLGDPDYATQTITMYIRDLAFTGAKQMGKSSAASMVLFFVTLVLSLLLFYIMRDKEAIKEKKQIKAAKKAQIAREAGMR